MNEDCERTLKEKVPPTLSHMAFWIAKHGRRWAFKTRTRGSSTSMPREDYLSTKRDFDRKNFCPPFGLDAHKWCVSKDIIIVGLDSPGFSLYGIVIEYIVALVKCSRCQVRGSQMPEKFLRTMRPLFSESSRIDHSSCLAMGS